MVVYKEGGDGGCGAGGVLGQPDFPQSQTTTTDQQKNSGFVKNHAAEY